MSSKSTSKSLPKMMKVAPNVTDPSMRNSQISDKDDPEELLRAMGGEDEEAETLRKTVFEGKNKTREEQSQLNNGDQGTNVLLIVVFALIVIALVALVVWMVTKQNESKKLEEAEMRARIQPHYRNNMPPNTAANTVANAAQNLAMQQAYAAQNLAMNQANQVNQNQGNQNRTNRDRGQANQGNRDRGQPSQQNDIDQDEQDPQDTQNTQDTQDTQPSQLAQPKQPSQPIQQTQDNKLSEKQKLDRILLATEAMMEDTNDLTEDDRTMLDRFSQEHYERNED